MDNDTLQESTPEVHRMPHMRQGDRLHVLPQADLLPFQGVGDRTWRTWTLVLYMPVVGGPASTSILGLPHFLMPHDSRSGQLTLLHAAQTHEPGLSRVLLSVTAVGEGAPPSTISLGFPHSLPLQTSRLGKLMFPHSTHTQEPSRIAFPPPLFAGPA